MFETTKLSPCFNGYQYLFIFIVAVVLDLIVHFFSLRKLNAIKSGTYAFGGVPELMTYYRSLSKKGPFPIDSGTENFYSSCNSWLLGALIAGTIAIFMLLIVDLILYVAESRNNYKSL